MVKNNVKRMAIVGIAAVAGMSLFACKKAPIDTSKGNIRIDVDADINDGNKINEKEDKLKGANNGNITITPEEAAKGKTIENTRRTVNEYGVTIYGRKLDKSEPIYSEIAYNEAKGATYTYTEYYSDAYGGKVYIKTNDKSGGRVIYNEKGVKFMVGRHKVGKEDLEGILANYRMSNAMAEAIDRTYKNK